MTLFLHKIGFISEKDDVHSFWVYFHRSQPTSALPNSQFFKKNFVQCVERDWQRQSHTLNNDLVRDIA